MGKPSVASSLLVGFPAQTVREVNDVWSASFASESLFNIGQIKCNKVTDDFSHKCVDAASDFDVFGQGSTRLVGLVAVARGCPIAASRR